MQKLLTNRHYNTWHSLLNVNLKEAFDTIQSKAWTPEQFKFATAVSVMSSSKIEGETLEVDSYVKHKMLDVEYLPNLVEKPNDLYAAYEYAKDHPLSKDHFHRCHEIATQHLLAKELRGQLRKGNMLIMNQQSQRVEYEAAAAHLLETAYERFWDELHELLQFPLKMEEAFYYASFIHLVFVKIHPFNDGNGRTGRLLEKWFLAATLGEKAWYIPSEGYYFHHLKDYYQHLARVGLFYEALNYENAIPFLLMLPQSLVFEN